MATTFKELTKKKTTVYAVEYKGDAFTLEVKEETGDVEIWYETPTSRFLVGGMVKVPHNPPDDGDELDISKRTVEYLADELLDLLELGEFDDIIEEIKDNIILLDEEEELSADGSRLLYEIEKFLDERLRMLDVREELLDERSIALDKEKENLVGLSSTLDREKELLDERSRMLNEIEKLLAEASKKDK